MPLIIDIQIKSTVQYRHCQVAGRKTTGCANLLHLRSLPSAAQTTMVIAIQKDRQTATHLPSWQSRLITNQPPSGQ
jgi:hypothetical protein